VLFGDPFFTATQMGLGNFILQFLNVLAHNFSQKNIVRLIELV
jgi:hypothetical protein